MRMHIHACKHAAGVLRRGCVALAPHRAAHEGLRVLRHGGRREQREEREGEARDEQPGRGALHADACGGQRAAGSGPWGAEDGEAALDEWSTRDGPNRGAYHTWFNLMFFSLPRFLTEGDEEVSEDEEIPSEKVRAVRPRVELGLRRTGGGHQGNNTEDQQPTTMLAHGSAR